MKKKMIALVMAMVMLLLASCGKEIPVTESTNESTESTEANNIETEKTDEATAEKTENEVLTNFDAVSDSDETGLNLKEYKYSFEDRKAADEGDAIFYLADFADDEQVFHLSNSISLYAFNGKCVGHTKEGIEINTIGKSSDWYYLMLDRDYRFVKVADVEATATDVSAKSEVAAPVETTTPTQSNTAVPVPSATENVQNTAVEEPVEVPATSDKYTPEEAIAVYRGIMEAGGMTWNPSLKNGGSWGTGFIYLDKGMPEWTAETNLESASIGNHGGLSWTQYYLEVTSSDDECVYITEWAD